MTSMTVDGAAEWIAARAAAGAGRVYIPGCGGEPLSLADAFRRRPELARGLTFFGVWIPGVNRTDWGSLGDGVLAETIFASPDWAASAAAGRLRVVPETYSTTVARFAAQPADVAVAHVTPPDGNGRCCLSIAADFTPTALRAARHRIAIINPALPRLPAGITVDIRGFDAVAVAEHPPLTVPPPELDPAFARIAGHIRSLLRDGDTLQFGLGKVQTAVLGALDGLRGIRIHSGMVSDPVAALLDGDVLDRSDSAVTTGVALGSDPFYRRLARADRVRMRDVAHTHDIRTLAALDRFVAINSVIEVDLSGQGNAEFLGDRAVSGGGGLLDFLRGARLSPGGRPIMALVSTAKGGTVSRIVPRLTSPAVSIPRADAGIVVTEHGIADLRGLDGEGRAMALIGIADPAHRDGLHAAWTAMRSGR